MSGRDRNGSMSPGGNRRYGVDVERRHAHRRRQPRRRPLERKAPLPVDPVENDHVARIDEVRVLDLLAVHPPDLGPAPRLLEELAGDPPQGVAFLHRVAVGDTGSLTWTSAARAAVRRRGDRIAAAVASEEFRYAKLLTHKASSGGGGSCQRPKAPQNKGLRRILHPQSAFCKLGAPKGAQCLARRGSHRDHAAAGRRHLADPETRWPL